MKIRRLELRDAAFMLACLQDKKVTRYLRRRDYASLTIQDMEKFIGTSWNDDRNVHFAIVSDIDEYMGTVSLKNIEDGCAEFAIIVRSEAMGHGYSWFGMESILEMAFTRYGLEYVYWCVSNKNCRALRFYDKHGFGELYNVPAKIKSLYEDIDDLKWYSVHKSWYSCSKERIAGCKVVRIKTLPTMNAGELSFFESTHEIPFEFRRFYYITKVPEGVRRGFHAHKKLKQFIFCPYGSVLLVLENKHGREEIELNDSSIGVIISECTWREMVWIQKDSVLCVAASDYYDASDYIRDYGEFRKYIGLS